MSVNVKSTPKPETAVAAPAPAPAPVQLELAIYKRYNRAGHLYEAEMVYEFSRAQAEVLLQEVEADTGRPIWRRYRMKPTQEQVRLNAEQRRVVNATADVIKPQEIDPNSESAGRRVDVGDESDLDDIPGLRGDGVEI